MAALLGATAALGPLCLSSLGVGPPGWFAGSLPRTGGTTIASLPAPGAHRTHGTGGSGAAGGSGLGGGQRAGGASGTGARPPTGRGDSGGGGDQRRSGVLPGGPTRWGGGDDRVEGSLDVDVCRSDRLRTSPIRPSAAERFRIAPGAMGHATGGSARGVGRPGRTHIPQFRPWPRSAIRWPLLSARSSSILFSPACGLVDGGRLSRWGRTPEARSPAPRGGNDDRLRRWNDPRDGWQRQKEDAHHGEGWHGQHDGGGSSGRHGHGRGDQQGHDRQHGHDGHGRDQERGRERGHERGR
jgi:hypothetical protein